MKAQTEILGITIMAMIFIVMFLVFMVLSAEDEPVTIAADFIQSNLATATLDSVLDTTVVCDDAEFRIEGMIQEHGENLVVESECTALYIEELLDWTFNAYGRGYEFSIDDQLIAFTPCSTEQEEQARHDIPSPGGIRKVELKIC